MLLRPLLSISPPLAVAELKQPLCAGRQADRAWLLRLLGRSLTEQVAGASAPSESLQTDRQHLRLRLPVVRGLCWLSRRQSALGPQSVARR